MNMVTKVGVWEDVALMTVRLPSSSGTPLARMGCWKVFGVRLLRQVAAEDVSCGKFVGEKIWQGTTSGLPQTLQSTEELKRT